MAFCETCGKEFKTEQGLAGHQQLKHARERSAERWDEGSASAGQHSAEGSVSAQPSTGQRLGERLERIEAALEQLLSPAAGHAHEMACSGCQQMSQEIYTRGRVEAIQEVTEIPGVLESIAFAKDSERWNAEHPDHPTVENWALVEQVKELVEGSRPKLIGITKAEESSPGDMVIRVVRTPEGEEVERQQIAAIIAQNGKRN